MNAMNNICLFGQPIFPLEVGEVEVEAITRIVHLYLCKYRNNTNTQTTIPIRHNKTNMLEIFWKQNSTTVHTHIHWICSSQISLKFLSLLPNERFQKSAQIFWDFTKCFDQIAKRLGCGSGTFLYKLKFHPWLLLKHLFQNKQQLQSLFLFCL